LSYSTTTCSATKVPCHVRAQRRRYCVATSTRTSEAAGRQALSIFMRAQQHIREDHHRLPALDHTDHAMQTFRQFLACCRDFHVTGFPEIRTAAAGPCTAAMKLATDFRTSYRTTSIMKVE